MTTKLPGSKESLTAIAALMQAAYGISGSVSLLYGEADFNFKISTSDGKAYILKIIPGTAEEEFLDFQNQILLHLQQSSLKLQTPQPVFNKYQEPFSKIQDGYWANHWLKIQSYIDGQVLAGWRPRNNSILFQWGESAAIICRALQDFDHTAAHRFYAWDPSQTGFSKKYLAYVDDDGNQKLAAHFFEYFESEIYPQLPGLRKGVNYNDAHELNLLIDNNWSDPRITGVIDFGDALYTHTINELAIACAYAAMDMPDPLAACCTVIHGFHSIFPLEEKELNLLYGLIAGRLLISVSHAAKNRIERPENEYLFISEQAGWDLLKKWKTIHADFALYRFRQACDLEPCPKHKKFKQWCQQQVNTCHSLIDLSDKKLIHLDLHVGSVDLGHTAKWKNVDTFSHIISSIINKNGADIGFGGYSEIRPFYSSDNYIVNTNDGEKRRTCHLGLDLWAPADAEVYAPLAGEVFSVYDNVGQDNYGPTIILKHQPDNDFVFYTLYGHLSRTCLTALLPGDRIKKGQVIAKLGTPDVNGGWPPHLHFQVILDILDNQHDFRGVCLPDEAPTWASICPDPGLLFPSLRSPDKNASSTEHILEKRKKYLGPNLSISYETPLHIVRGHMSYLYDQQGQRYLDTVNNVAHLGHQHPRVVRAATRQISVLNTNTRYLHPAIVEYAEDLLNTFPQELNKIFFVNSGSEANELALRMASVYSGERDIISVEMGYHGNTGATVDISSYKFDRKGGKGKPELTHLVPMPDNFRGVHAGENNSGELYAAYIENRISEIHRKDRNISAFICESMLSCGGQIPLPENYLKTAYAYTRAVGGLCIADEVQVGFGRMGKTFWGFELQDVVPDIVTLGKPMGNGHPIGAVVTTSEVAETFNTGMEYFNTFGGNPVSCRIGHEVLQVILEESSQQHADEAGSYFIEQLIGLQEKYPLIADIRGFGLFLGFELCVPGTDKIPASSQAHYLVNRMRQRGVLMSTDGPDENVIKIKPPMCITLGQIDFVIDNLDQVLNESAMINY